MKKTKSASAPRIKPLKAFPVLLRGIPATPVVTLSLETKGTSARDARRRALEAAVSVMPGYAWEAAS